MRKVYQHLDYSERALIQTQLTLGMQPSAIAAGLCRSRSTISRELRRNGWLPRTPGRIAGGYRALLADRRSRHLKARAPVERKLQPGNPLWLSVLEHLRQGLSPWQISRTLARMPDPVRLSHETIYTALYAMPRGELRANLLDLLRRGHKARRTRRSRKDRRNLAIPNMTLIDERPIEVQMRLIPGHWEGDLIIGKGNRSQVGTLVERTTLFVALVQLDSAKAVSAAQGFTRILNRFEHHKRRSMTYDQGTEMAHHQTLTEATGVDVYFAHPHAPWERGLSENTNGLLRQYLPRGTDLSLFSQQQLDEIAWKLNVRPRKPSVENVPQSSSSQKEPSTSSPTGSSSHLKSIQLHFNLESTDPRSCSCCCCCRPPSSAPPRSTALLEQAAIQKPDPQNFVKPTILWKTPQLQTPQPLPEQK